MALVIVIHLGSLTQFSSNPFWPDAGGAHAESKPEACHVVIIGSSSSSVLHLPRSTSSSKMICDVNRFNESE